MPTYISLLRGINVSGTRVKMAELADLYAGLGLENVATYIQSGNVVFVSPLDPASLATQIREAIDVRFGYAVDVQVYGLDAWRALVEGNPFAGDGDVDPKHLHVTLLSESPDADLLSAIDEINTGGDAFRVEGRLVYLHCPNGYGRSKLGNTFWERKLKVVATTRNWNTVNKLLAMGEAVD